MHEVSEMTSDISIDAEGKQKPLWTWLVLCDDSMADLPWKGPRTNRTQTQ